MSIRKSIFSFFLIVTILIPTIPVFAYEFDSYSDEEVNVFSQSVEKFSSLGAFDVTKGIQDVVTRAEFAHMLTGLFKLSGNSELSFSDIASEQYAEDIKCISGNGMITISRKDLFYPNDPITLRDLSRGLVIALGYKNDVQRKYGDKDSGYVTKAKELKLYEGTKSKNEVFALTYGEVLNAFDNALSTKLMKLYIDEENKSTYKKSEETVLEEFLNCEEKKGIVTATPLADLYGSEEVGEGSVRVGKNTYSCLQDTTDLLGYSVVYYVDKDNDSLKFIGKDFQKNSEVLVNSKDIQGYSNRKYSYTTERRATKTISLPVGCAIVYNGRANTNENVLNINMEPKNGTVKFVDNNDDGKYEVVFIEEYKSIVVGNVDIITKTVYDKFDNELSFTVDEIDDKYISIKSTEEKTMELKNIKVGNVVSVAQSIDHTITKVIVSSNKVDGIMRSQDDEYVVIEDKKYELLSDSRKVIDNNAKKNVIAYIDHNNKVVYIEAKQETVEVAYLIYAYIDESSEKLHIRFCNVSGTVETAECAEKVYINDIKRNTHENSLADLKGDQGEITPQIISLVRNSDGMVNRIYTVWTKNQEDCPKEALVLNSTITNTDYRYIRAQNMFMDYRTSLSSNCKIFFVPDDTSDVSGYSVLGTSDMKDDEAYGYDSKPFYAYVLGGDGLQCNYAVAVATKSPKRSSSYGIIKEVSQVYDEEKEETCTKIKILYSGETVLYVYDEEGIDVSNVKPYSSSASSNTFSLTPGDLILYNYQFQDGKSKVTSLQMIYDYETQEFLSTNPSTTNLKESIFYMGDVWKKNSGIVGICVADVNSQYSNPKQLGLGFDRTAQNYRVDSLSAATIYRANESGKDIEQIDFSGIIDYSTSNVNYSKVIIMSKLGRATCCYVIN